MREDESPTSEPLESDEGRDGLHAPSGRANGQRRRSRGAELARQAEALSIGIRMVLCIALGALGGWWVDQRTGTEIPWAMIAGFALGTAAAFRALLSLAGPPTGKRGRGR